MIYISLNIIYNKNKFVNNLELKNKKSYNRR